MQTAVIPPIGLQRGDTVCNPCVVDRENNKVFAILQAACDLTIKGSVTALVLANLVSVQPDKSAIVGSAEMKKGPSAGPRGVLEVLLVPDGAFVVQKLGALGIPVTRDFERGGVGEVVILRMHVGIERRVHEEAVFAKILVEVVKAGGILVDDDMPV